MPELPEVESVRRSLAQGLIGRSIVRARLYRRDIAAVVDDVGRSRPRNVRARPDASGLLEGARILEVGRRGKELAIVAEDGRVLAIHLGMSGHVEFVGPDEPRPAAATREHVHAFWTVGDGAATMGLQFRDPRRFGGLWSLASREALVRCRWAWFGVDGLEVNGAELAAATEGSGRAVKAALLDQRVIAGVGNIYADESLFRAAIDPRRPCRSLDAGDWDRLAREIRGVLNDAVEAGGSTVRDYAGADREAGDYQSKHLVYGRGGLACERCGGVLVSLSIAQRTTVLCGVCQR